MDLSFWCVLWSLGFSVLKWRFFVRLCSVILDQARCDPEIVSKLRSALFRMVIWTYIRLNSHNSRMQFGCFRRKSRARRLSRFALPIVSNEKHSWFSAEIDLHLFSCISLLWTFSVVLGLFSCCVPENTALLSSGAVFWLSRAILDQVCPVHEIPPLCSEPWSTLFLMGKWTRVEFSSHCGACSQPVL